MLRTTYSRRNVVDPLFLRRIKKAYANYSAAMSGERNTSMPREAYVDIDEKGPAWYVGHMARASRVLDDKLKDIDFFIELRDARLPFTTENPNLTRLARKGDKPRIIVFNKADLSNEETNRALHNYFENTEGTYSLFTSANRTWKDTVMAVQKFVTNVLPPKTHALTSHVGCVVGAPSVGKSTLINSLRMAHEFQFHREDMRRPRGREEVAIEPGTTRSVKLVPMSRDPNIVLYDTPGLTLPGNVHKEAGLKLAACGILPTNTLTLTDASVARYIYEVMHAAGADEHLAECLHLPRAALSFEDCAMMLCERSGRSAQTKMGVAEFTQAYKFIIGDFQLGKLGRITLDRIPKRMLPSSSSSSFSSSYGDNSENQSSSSSSSATKGEQEEDFTVEHTIESLDVYDENEVGAAGGGGRKSYYGVVGSEVLKSVHNGKDSGNSFDASTIISRKRGPIASADKTTSGQSARFIAKRKSPSSSSSSSSSSEQAGKVLNKKTNNSSKKNFSRGHLVSQLQTKL